MPQPSSFIRIENGWPTIDVGALRHAITIKNLAPASPPAYDAAGPILSPATFTTALAAIETVRGLDVIKSGQNTTQLFLTITIWYQPGILPNMLVVSDNGSVYEIQAIENILELNVVLVLNCVGLGMNQ